MKKLLTTLFVLSTYILPAQITIIDSDIESAGDTARVSSANIFTSVVDFTQTGANFVWDFSTLVADTQTVDSFITPGQAGFFYALYFNTAGSHKANIAQGGIDISAFPGLPISDPFLFFYKTSGRYEQAGFGGSVGGTDIPVGFGNKDVIYNFPLNFGDQDTSDSDFSLSVPGTGSIDGIRHRETNVDGWGSLTTPFGTFDVLRMKSYITEHDSVHNDSSGVDIIVDQLPVYEYKWIGKNQDIPLLQINTQIIFGTEQVTSIRYRDSIHAPVIIGLNTISNTDAIYLSGNPSDGESTIVVNADKAAAVTIRLFDASGKQLKSEVQFAYPGKNEFKINTQNLSSAIYFVSVQQGEKEAVNLRLLMTGQGR